MNNVTTIVKIYMICGMLFETDSGSLSIKMIYISKKVDLKKKIYTHIPYFINDTA